MLKVVVVEDEELVRKGIVLTVDWAGAGCAVVGEAANGEEGNTKPRFLHRATILSMVFSVFFMVSSPFCLVAQSNFKIACTQF